MTSLDPIQVISRGDAVDAGLKKFFTGKPCIKGHVTYRYTANGICTACQRDHLQRYKPKPYALIRMTFDVHPDDTSAMEFFAGQLNHARVSHHPGAVEAAQDFRQTVLVRTSKKRPPVTTSGHSRHLVVDDRQDQPLTPTPTKPSDDGWR